MNYENTLYVSQKVICPYLSSLLISQHRNTQSNDCARGFAQAPQINLWQFINFRPDLED